MAEPTPSEASGRTRKGKLGVQRKTMRARLTRGLRAIRAWCEEHRHTKVPEQCRVLNAKLRGQYQ